MGYSVIPVKTGIQSFQYLGRFWIPACAGMTTFYEAINPWPLESSNPEASVPPMPFTFQ